MTYLTLVCVLLLTGCTKGSETSQQSPLEQVGSETPVPEQAEQDPSSGGGEQSGEDLNQQAVPEGWGEAPPLPTSMMETIEYPVGRFHGVTKIEADPEAKAFYAKLPVPSENASDAEIEQYFTYIYSLVKPDFPNPRSISMNYSQSMPDGSGAVPAELQKETYNVEIVLDASGSMANKMDGKTRMELAKGAIADYLSSLPKEANVGLRVYGHKGTGSDAEKNVV
ncbi:VWA domain-containing protein [Brevibacillus humidisoli]|uniref:vWA domain-containing protein n=1 Tax=Brevibacillus humidisoli TaxID=2895522 RepID=UPI001E3DAB99|nr:VWA domain-containing protein [Brevibacillus humidisoli]UFJ39256.1 VWA domain-containing protein [Brevibacillus humidisoli]